MARYRKIGGGRHYEGTGKDRLMFTKGQVVESDRDLAELYPNSFEPVGRDSAASKGQAAPIVGAARAVARGNAGAGEPANIYVTADEPLPHGTTRGAQVGVTRKLGGDPPEEGEVDTTNAENFVADGDEENESILDGGDEVPAAAPKTTAPKKGKKKAKGKKATAAAKD